MPTTKAKSNFGKTLLVASRRSNRRMCTHDYEISTMVWIKFNFQEKKQSDWRKDRVALETYIVFQKV